MSKILGIDLGTTNSVMAISEDGSASVLPNVEGKPLTPSVVNISSDGKFIVGELAKRRMSAEPERTIYSVKTLMGKKFSEVEDILELFHYQVVADEAGDAAVLVDGKSYSPPEISAKVLQYLVSSAEECLGEKIEYAVITVPAYFDNRQREATIRAGELAGLDVLRIINEPTAAALSYGLNSTEKENIAVFDFGGGTFDISILGIEGDVIEVKATCGDTFLGGHNINHEIYLWLSEILQRDYPDLDLNSMQIKARIQEACEIAKCELSFQESTEVNMPFLGADKNNNVINVSVVLERKNVEGCLSSIFQALKAPCVQALQDAALDATEVKKVLLAGGSSRIPAVQQICEDVFSQSPSELLNPDESIACGAAIHAEMLTGNLQEILLLDVTPLSLGIEVEGGLFDVLIGRNNSIPTTSKRIFTTTRDNQIAISIHVLQGERRLAKDNRTLDRFRMDGLPPAPREVPQIEVSFSIDVNGVLKVSAKEMSSGKSEEIEVRSYRNISEEYVERVISEAKDKVDEDMELEQVALIKRRCFRLYDQLVNEIRTNQAFLPDEVAMRIEKDSLRQRVALKSFDFTEICKIEEELKLLRKELHAYLEDS